MYTLMAVYVHFNCFIHLTINSHTNPFYLASSKLGRLGSLLENKMEMTWTKLVPRLHKNAFLFIYSNIFSMFIAKVQMSRKSRFVRLSEQNSPHYHLKGRILDVQIVSAKNGAKKKQNGANFKINNTYSNINHTSSVWESLSSSEYLFLAAFFFGDFVFSYPIK